MLCTSTPGQKKISLQTNETKEEEDPYDDRDMDEIDDQRVAANETERGKSPRHLAKPGEDPVPNAVFIYYRSECHAEKNDPEPGDERLIIQSCKSIVGDTKRDQKGRPPKQRDDRRKGDTDYAEYKRDIWFDFHHDKRYGKDRGNAKQMQNAENDRFRRIDEPGHYRNDGSKTEEIETAEKEFLRRTDRVRLAAGRENEGDAGDHYKEKCDRRTRHGIRIEPGGKPGLKEVQTEEDMIQDHKNEGNSACGIQFKVA